MGFFQRTLLHTELRGQEMFDRRADGAHHVALESGRPVRSQDPSGNACTVIRWPRAMASNFCETLMGGLATMSERSRPGTCFRKVDSNSERSSSRKDGATPATPEKSTVNRPEVFAVSPFEPASAASKGPSRVRADSRLTSTLSLRKSCMRRVFMVRALRKINDSRTGAEVETDCERARRKTTGIVELFRGFFEDASREPADIRGRNRSFYFAESP